MKYKHGYCHTLCLLNALAGCFAGAGIISKYVCPGDSVDAFQNITFNNCSSVVSLYIHREINILIVRWSFENCNQSETLLSDYKDRVFLYGNGTISMHNVHPWDQAKYIVNCQMGNISMEGVVQIIVMTAPANDCKPKILHLKKNLVASLKAHLCGKPVATLYWKGYGDVPNTTGPILKLNPGNQDGTYYACIEGPALTCVKNARDYCSTIIIGEDKSPPISLETRDDVNMAIFIVVPVVSGILLLPIAVIVIRKRCRNTTSRSLQGSGEHRLANGIARGTLGENKGRADGRKIKDKNSVPGPSKAIIIYVDQYATPRSLEESVEHRGANGNARGAFGENEGMTERREVTDRNSVQGHSKAIIRSEDQSDDFPDSHMPLLKMDQNKPTHDDMLSGQHTFPWEKHNEPWKKKISWRFASAIRDEDQPLLSWETHQAACYTPLKLSHLEKSQQKQPLTINPLQNTMREKQVRE